MTTPHSNTTPTRSARPAAGFSRAVVFIALMVALIGFVSFGEALALHPEDDFCEPDSGISPELCRKLAEADRSGSDLSSSAPLTNNATQPRAALETALTFLKIGLNHILPSGLDHILFVLCLFFASQTLRQLIVQISIFTLAHTATLGLSAAGVIDPPLFIVEPLIALSIAFVAIENLMLKNTSKWRLIVIFGFGLFHGMGFAGFIRTIGLPGEQFWPALIGFNIGVELGQLSVVLAAALISVPLRQILARTGLTYRQAVVIPSSILIAVISLWWVLERSLGL